MGENANNVMRAALKELRENPNFISWQLAP